MLPGSVATRVPSIYTSTLVMLPSESDAEIVTLTVPLTVEPADGDVITTVGGELPLLTLLSIVTVTIWELATLL